MTLTKYRGFGVSLLRDSLHWTEIEALTPAHIAALRECVAILGRARFSRSDLAELRRELLRGGWRTFPEIKDT